MSARRRWAGVMVWMLCLFPAVGQHVYTLSVTSTVSRITLVELFTSEGCSSCPPAEAWLRTLNAHDGLWKTFIPVAFHVDYWDDLGWKDRFASPVFTHHQRKYKEAWASRYLYTPTVAVQGHPWPRWREPDADLALDTNAVGVLSLDYSDGMIRMAFDPVRKFSKAYDAHIALLGLGIESDVKKGENQGKVLQHDFVVLQYAQRRVKQRKGTYYDRMPMDVTLPENVPARALVVWVTENRSVYPLQTVGGMLIAGPSGALSQ